MFKISAAIARYEGQRCLQFPLRSPRLWRRRKEYPVDFVELYAGKQVVERIGSNGRRGAGPDGLVLDLVEFHAG
jgi:hypothetical protein